MIMNERLLFVSTFWFVCLYVLVCLSLRFGLFLRFGLILSMFWFVSLYVLVLFVSTFTTNLVLQNYHKFREAVLSSLWKQDPR